MGKEKISETIYELRKKQGLTQSELGKLVGVSNRAVSKWESGISVPSIETLSKLCKALHVSADRLFTGAGALEGSLIKNENPMASIKELYRIGRGPSSSHTIGPERACFLFKEKNPSADSFKAVLYGSLAQTGKGHGTDKTIIHTFAPLKVKIEFDYNKADLPHPNTMELFAYKNGKETDRRTVSSVGGGKIVMEGMDIEENQNLYPLHTFDEICTYCKENNIRLWQYVEKIESADIRKFLSKVWEAMKAAIKAGISDSGELPGGLHVQKKAKHLFEQTHIDESAETKENRLVCAYAFAVSEQNASAETIVTAPTCGASGVLPAVLYYMQQKKGFSDDDIINALATASVIGNLIKTNASISGAECGCQAEIGSACSMAAAALGELFSMNLEQIEYAAEVALEHHLGLTCDPIYGLVQIPCIERNAVAAMRAINAVNLANFLTNTRKISFDLVVQTMYETGKDLSKHYRETSTGGLAKLYQ